MAVILMQKVAVLAHKDVQEQVIDMLHKEGVMEITPSEDVAAPDHSQVDFRKADVQYAIDTLSAVAPKETLIAAAKRVTEDEIIKTTHATDVLDIVEQLRKLEESDTEAERTIAETQMLQEQLSLWSNLPDALDSTSNSTYTKRVFGTVSSALSKTMEEAVAEACPRTDLQCCTAGKQQEKGYRAIIWKEDVQTFEECATRYGWTTVDLPSLAGNPVQESENAKLTEAEMLQLQQKNHEKRVQLSIELPKLIQVAQYMEWLDDKQFARESMNQTSSTIRILGWMPKKKVDLVEDRLQKELDAVAILPVEPDADEEPPIQIWNKDFFAPFEAVTRLYGLPQTGEMDPTLPLMPFFILYFGLCLTDAGYGLTLSLLTGLLIWKAHLTRQQAKLVWLLFYAGFVTFAVSIPFGGWFGVLPEQAPDWLTYTNANGDRRFLGQIWDLQKDVNFFRNLTLCLGVIQLLFGISLAGYWKWIHGKKLEAFLQHFSVHILVAALALHSFVPFAGSGYVAIAALALFVWGQGSGAWWLRPITGALGAVNFGIGIMSNTLSYLRILALGLATGALAFAINQIAAVISALLPSFIGIPVFILILLGGHLISVALNGLGSFVHSGRLQFIEFFGQFFGGGGREFVPFRRKTQSAF